MTEDFIEIDCFISVEPSKELQLLNNSAIKKYEISRILETTYKYQIPEMGIITDIPSFDNFRKYGFENTNTKIKTILDESEISNNKFGVYFDENGIHFVPVARPILKLYTFNIDEVEYKKVNNLVTDLKINNEDFYSSCPGSTFKPISTQAKMKHPFIPAKYMPHSEDLTEFRSRTLSCYGQNELKDNETVIEKITKAKKSLPYTTVVTQNNTTKKVLLEREVLDVMIKVKVEKFNEIMKTLKDHNKFFYGETVEKNVLSYLPTISLMIRGLWVIKSEVLYRVSPDKFEDQKYKIMCMVRDYVLCLFHADIETTPTRIKSVTKILSLDAAEVLKQFASPITNSNSGKPEWKYHDIHYKSINKYHEINEDHNRAMISKTKEVCSFFKLESILGDSCTSKRKRTISQQSIESKRSRIHSVSTELVTITNNVIDNNGQLALTSEIDGQFYFDSDEIADDMEQIAVHMKEEPTTSPRNEVYCENNKKSTLIKTELSEVTSDDDTDLSHAIQFPKCFPSINIYQKTKDFIGQQFDCYQILPINELATMFYENNLSTMPSNDYRRWNDLNKEEIIKELCLCLCEVLDEFHARRIDVNIPQVNNELKQQVLYLSNAKYVLEDEKFIIKMVQLTYTSGSIKLAELKKALTQDKDTKHLMTNSNMLRDKLQKYCHYSNRKYNLRYSA